MHRLSWTFILTLAFISSAYCDWEPEVLLRRQGDRLGWFYEKVEGLGDWTGDGIDDFAVLSYSVSADTSVIDIWWGGETLSSEPDTTICQEESLVFFRIETAGDISGDDVSELIAAAWHDLIVYRGGHGQVDVLQVLHVPQVDVTSLVVPGDISGDGIPDLILGDSNWDNSRGRIYVYLGTPTGFEGPVETMEGTHPATGLLGSGLTSGADMNADGWRDFACRLNAHDSTFALFHPRPGNYLGSYEIFEGSYGLTLVPQAYESGRPALVLRHQPPPPASEVSFYINLGGGALDTIPDTVLTIGDLFYWSVPAYVGDVNHDGWGDWVAGDELCFGGLGAFVVFLGGPWISNYTYWHGGFNGWAGEGKHLNGVGDVNGDGIDDFGVICAFDMGWNERYGQIVIVAGDEDWHVAVDDRRAVPLRSSVTIQAYPNPSNAETRIEVLDVPPGRATVEVWNVLGQRVWKQEVQASGGHVSLTWRMQDARGQSVAAGIYFVQIVQRGVSLARHKVVVTR